MGITQTSKIQVRSGLYENLPQLDTGELGWAIDTQQLFIGNGNIAQGAPILGNTELAVATSSNPTGPAGGDLSGTYPNPTVVKVNGGIVPISTAAVGTNSSGQFVSALSPHTQLLNVGSGNLAPQSSYMTVTNYINVIGSSSSTPVTASLVGNIYGGSNVGLPLITLTPFFRADIGNSTGFAIIMANNSTANTFTYSNLSILFTAWV